MRLEGLGVRVPTVTPVPESGITSDGFEAVDVIVTVPVLLPDDEGANETLNVVLCPAVSVTGVVMPLKLKSVPVTAT